MGALTSPAMDGARLVPLRQIPTEGGAVLHVLRADSPDCSGFGEVYCSEVRPGAVRAWKRHREQTQRLAVPAGLLRVALYDDRPSSPARGAVKEILLGRPDHYNLLVIPPGLWYGFAAAGPDTALIVNCTDIPHHPDETDRLPPDAPEIPYAWGAPCAA